MMCYGMVFVVVFGNVLKYEIGIFDIFLIICFITRGSQTPPVGDDTIDCGREFQGWTILYAKKCLSRLDLGLVVVIRSPHDRKVTYSLLHSVVSLTIAAWYHKCASKSGSSNHANAHSCVVRMIVPDTNARDK